LLSNSAATTGSSSGSAAEVPGVLVVNKSETGPAGSKATVASVLGIDLLSHTNGQATGLLAPVSSLLNTVNTALCPDGGAGTQSCIVVALANSSNGPGAKSASTTLLGINSAADGGLNVAGSTAGSASNGGTCIDGARGYVLISKKQFQDGTGQNPLINTRRTSATPC
jgi:hypothetical protein